MITRRRFMASAGLALAMPHASSHGQEKIASTLSETDLGRIASAPILHLKPRSSPVIIESMELLRKGNEFLVRIRSTDGATAVIVANSSRLRDASQIFLRRVAPFFIRKDARKLEALLVGLYRHSSNYKWQGLAFWSCVAAAEIAILELLGQVEKRSIAELFGGRIRKDIAVYRASSNRGNTPEAVVEHLKQLASRIGARAVKLRLGGRMSRNRDSLPGRTEALIPLARKTLGDEMTLYADSNSSYDVTNAIRIGRLLEDNDYAFFEEPCPFDHLWETRKVAAALKIPIAGGEQEFSLRRFQWAIANRGVDIVQPDLHYFGGFIRCTKVARMANAAGMPCTVHMSGAGLGYLYTLHFASYVKDPGAHQEFKGTSNIPVECDSSTLKCKNGVLQVPTGPGFGVRIDPDYIKKARRVEPV